MEYQELVQLIDKIDQSSLKYFEYRFADESLTLAKDMPTLIVEQSTQKVDATQEILPMETVANKAVVTEQVVTQVASYDEVKAPLVGVVYLQPEPSAAPFVAVGEQVSKGQVLCIIEAMKLMNEVVAPFDCIVKGIHAVNETVVEYDQRLFEIEKIGA